MKTVHYAGGKLLTGDAIADAVVRFGEALALRQSSATIEIPVRLADGDVEMATALIGPASQIVAIPEHNEFDEIHDEALVDRLDREAGMLGDAKPEIGEHSSSDSNTFDDHDL